MFFYLILYAISYILTLEFRQYIGENYPPVLEYYYRFGELISRGQTSSIRKIDSTYWEHEPAASVPKSE